MPFLDLLLPLEIAISHVVVGAHDALVRLGLPGGSGAVWALSVVLLVVAVRLLLLPLAVHQARSVQRGHLAAPRVQEIRARHRGRTDLATLRQVQEETRAVHRDVGYSPLGCLPALLQVPVFLALFRVLLAVAEGRSVGALDPELVERAAAATLWGAPLSDGVSGADGASTLLVAAALTAGMAAVAWLTSRAQLARTPAAALDGPVGQSQRLLVHVVPAVTAVSGLLFPVGVLLYLATTGCWSLAQQVALHRWLPAPDLPTPAPPLADAAGPGSVPGEAAPGPGPAGQDRSRPSGHRPPRRRRSRAQRRRR